ncbi:MAG: hypothetical protein ACQEQ4_07805 [Fibrobacterota bacterium]
MKNGILVPLAERSLDIIANISSLLDWKDLEAIPGGLTVIKTLNLVQSMSDRIFLNKLIRFYSQCSEVPFDKRVEFIEKYDDSKVGENLLVMINDIESFDKAEAIGKIFNEFLLENINKDQFDRIVYALNNIYYEDLEFLLTPLEELPYLDEAKTAQLENLGLLTCRSWILDEGGGGGNPRKHLPSEIGIIVANCLLKSSFDFDVLYDTFKEIHK